MFSVPRKLELDAPVAVGNDFEITAPLCCKLGKKMKQLREVLE